MAAADRADREASRSPATGRRPGGAGVRPLLFTRNSLSSHDLLVREEFLNVVNEFDSILFDIGG
jgi:hypothetical protein